MADHHRGGKATGALYGGFTMNFLKKIIMLLNRETPTDTLIKRGMKVGENFNRQQGCFLDPTHCFLITIGDDVTMSIRVTVMAHDASTKKTIGYTKIGQVHIGDHVFIGANATILPGVTIGDYAVVGAGSIVTHDVPARTVVAGVPAKVICGIDEYTEKFKLQMNSENTFGDDFRMGNGLTDEKKKAIISATDGKIAYIR